MGFCSATLGICLLLACCQRGSGCNGGLVGPGPGSAPDFPRPSPRLGWSRAWQHARLSTAVLYDDSNELNSTDQLLQPTVQPNPTALQPPTDCPARRSNAAFYRVRRRSLFHLSPEARPRPLSPSTLHPPGWLRPIHYRLASSFHGRGPSNPFMQISRETADCTRMLESGSPCCAASS